MIQSLQDYFQRRARIKLIRCRLRSRNTVTWQLINEAQLARWRFLLTAGKAVDGMQAKLAITTKINHQLVEEAKRLRYAPLANEHSGHATLSNWRGYW